MMLRTLAALLCVFSLLPAQEKPPEGENAMDARMRAARARAAKEGLDPSKEEMSKEEIEKMAASEVARERDNTVIGASSFCRFIATVKPAKLMPGQTGTMVVTAILSGQAVLPSPAPLERIGMEQQGVVTLGATSFRPAEAGRLAPGYIGRPVYDNYAIFEIPVTMSPQAEIGKKQPIQADFRFEIFDGATAQSIGKFIDRAATEVEVGQALDPQVKMPRGKGDKSDTVEAPAPPPVQAATPVETPAAAPPVREVEAQPARVVPDAPVRAPEPAASPASSTPHDSEESTSVLPFAIGGGLLLLVLVLLLARKK